MENNVHPIEPAELLDLSWDKMRSDPAKALSLAQEAEGLALKSQDQALIDLARLHIGWCLVSGGQPDKAFAIFLELASILEPQQAPALLAKLFNGLGVAQQALSHFADALTSYLKARDFAQQANDSQTLFSAMNYMASAHIELEQFNEALSLVNQVEANGIRHLPEPVRANLLLIRGTAELGFGKIEQSERNLIAAISEGKQQNYRHLVFNGLLTLASLEAKRQKPEQAQQLIEEAVNESLLMANYLLLARAYYLRAEVYSSVNQTVEAIENLNKALFFFNGKITTTRLHAHIRLSEIYENLNEYNQALHHLKEARELERIIFQREASSQVKALQIQLENEKKQLESEYQRIRNRELKSENRQLELINLIGRDIASSLNLNHILATLYRHFNESMAINVCGIALVEKDQRHVDFRYFIDNGEQTEPFVVPMSKQVSFATYCIRNRNLVHSNNALVDSYQLFGDHKEYVAQGSLIYVPMFDSERLFALFTVQINSIDGFNKEDVELIRSVSSFLSVAIQNALTHQKIHALTEEVIREKKEIEHLALHDRLTGLANRIGLENEFDFLIASRCDAFALVYIDLDSFKPINDLHGHEFGDEVLKILAERMIRAIRHSDIAARIGGDEFVVLLKNVTRYQDAEQIVEQIRERIRSPIVLGKQRVTLTASLGVALYPHHGDTLKSLMRRADEAMYQIKNVSKDGVSYLRH